MASGCGGRNPGDAFFQELRRHVNCRMPMQKDL
jgi:hypothetical protein